MIIFVRPRRRGIAPAIPISLRMTRTPGFYLLICKCFPLSFNPGLIIVPIIGRYFDVNNEIIFVNPLFDNPSLRKLALIMALSIVIINADDFGMNSSVNRAILSSVEQGLVTSTSIMANMPGFEEAAGLVRAHGRKAPVAADPWLPAFLRRGRFLLFQKRAAAFQA
jgi:hypothetical protein